MCIRDSPVPAPRAKEMGLVDELAGEDSLAADAIAFARAKIADGPRPTRERAVFGDVGVIEKLKTANAKRWRGFEAVSYTHLVMYKRQIIFCPITG